MKNKIYAKSNKIGWISVSIGQKSAVKLEFLRWKDPNSQKSDKKLAKWLNEYFLGKKTTFPYKLELYGTHFQLKVWESISKIPFGKTKTYGDIAKEIGHPKAVRAAGTACGKNPLPLVIPCHRVVGSNSVGGFSCGLNLKKMLLRIES